MSAAETAPRRFPAGRPPLEQGAAVVAARLRRAGSRPVLAVGAVVLLVAAYLTGAGRDRSGTAGTLVYDVVLYNAVPVLAVVLCWRTSRRLTPERWAWQSASVACALIVAGNLTYVLAVVPQAQPPFPSMADAWWLAAYPALFAVPVVLLRTRVPHASRVSLLDGAIGALAVAAVVGTWVLGPSLSSPEHDLLATAALLAYPVSDLVLLALVGAVLAVLGARADRVVLLVCGVLTGKFLADLLIAADEAAGTYVPGSWGDVVAVLNAVLICVSATIAPDPTASEPTAEVRTGWRWVGIPVGCNLAALVVLGVEWGRPGIGVGELCALGCLAASLARTAVTLRELRALGEVRRQALTDELTGLANRRALVERAAASLALGRPVGLLVLDLDGFKAVNDGLGHAAGDDLLRTLAVRLDGALRPSDVLARLGGDEFAVLLPDADRDQALECAARLRGVVVEPVSLGGRAVRVGASVGVATAPADGQTVGALVAAADTGMYAAKAAGGGVAEAPAGRVPASRVTGGDPGADVVLVPLLDDAGRPAAHEARTADGAPADVTALAGALPGMDVPDAGPVWATVSAADVAGARTADRLAAALLRAGLAPASVTCVLPHTLAASDVPAGAALLAALRTRGIGTAVDSTVLQVLGRTGGGLPADVVRLHLDAELPPAAVRHAVGLVTALGGRAVAVTGGRDVVQDPGCPVLRTTRVPSAGTPDRGR